MIPKWMEGLKTLCTCRHDPSKTGLNWGLFLSPDNLEDAALRLFQAGFFLEDISGLDTADGFVAVYHFGDYVGSHRVALYVIVHGEEPSIPSISGIYSGALWHERETKDFFGIRFTGHPDPRPLLLPEDMVDHPLLKEDKNRAALRDLVDPGEIVERDPGFLFFEESGSPMGDAKPKGEKSEVVNGEL